MEGRHAAPPRRRLGRSLERSPLFEPLAEAELPNDHELPPGGLEDRAASTSFIAALPEQTRREALADVREFEARAPKPIVLPHICELFAFKRRGLSATLVHDLALPGGVFLSRARSYDHRGADGPGETCESL